MADQWWMIETATEGVAELARQFGRAACITWSVEIARTLLMAHSGKPCEKPARGVFLHGHFEDSALLKSPYED